MICTALTGLCALDGRKNNRISATGGRLTIFIDKLEKQLKSRGFGPFFIYSGMVFIIPGLLIPDRYS